MLALPSLLKLCTLALWALVVVTGLAALLPGRRSLTVPVLEAMVVLNDGTTSS